MKQLKKVRLRKYQTLAAVFGATTALANADVVIPGADGSDGVFNPTNTVTVIDLGAAPVGTWNGPNGSPGNGVYDQAKWAVVFRYSSVNIPPGFTVRFVNNVANAPVIWLVSGEARIGGTISLNGGDQQGSLLQSIPGPGGFRGGVASASSSGQLGSGGFGIGGGDRNAYNGNGGEGTGGSFQTRPDGRSGNAYGSSTLIPLIGGSGGGGSYGIYITSGGGAGGGAILIAATARVALDGTISARGGNSLDHEGRDAGGSGSGGAVRIVSDTISGAGLIDVRGGSVTDRGGRSSISEAYGGFGRIRLEAGRHIHSIQGSGGMSTADLTGGVKLWPDESAPRVAIQSVAGTNAPAFPNGGISAEMEVGIANGAATVIVEASNIPISTGKVRVRATPNIGAPADYPCTLVSGGDTRSIWRANVPMSPGVLSLQVRATTE